MVNSIVDIIRNTKKCDKWNVDDSLSNFNKHYEKCEGVINYWTKKKLGLLKVDNEVSCKFCNKICKNSNSQRNHSRLCKFNPNKQSTFFETNSNDLRIKNKVHKNQYIKAKELGLPKPQISEETREKLRQNLKNIDKNILKKRNEKTSETICKKMAKGEWHTFKDCKNYEYKGVILNGSWELKYAMYLDEKNISWKRCDESFPYIFNNKKHRYIPDFYLIDDDTYIEVKGYVLDKDYAKWNQFPKKLKVLFKKDLEELNII